MKLLPLLAVPALLLPFGLATTASSVPAKPLYAGDFEVDPGHSSVVFRVKHAGAAWFYGTFNHVQGAFTMNADDASASNVIVEISADSIDSNSGDRDGHLKSPDFLNTAEFPTITFESTAAKPTDEGLELTGNLTMLGKTKEITATAVHVGEGEFRGQRSGWETTFEIKRSEFGMTYGVEAGVLGDEVRITVSLEGVQR